MQRRAQEGDTKWTPITTAPSEKFKRLIAPLLPGGGGPGFEGSVGFCVGCGVA
jgi:hypothetical protein